jgi:hypothetical protein
MICLVAFVVFGFLGLFSLKYRNYAKEAFDCVFRRITLRKCNTRFDRKVKAKVSTKITKVNRPLGRFVHVHFEAIGWVFTILMVASFIYSGYAAYNLYMHGTCDPVSGNCVFVSDSPDCVSPDCDADGCACDDTSCEPPAFEACDGNCLCDRTVCGA